jgi:hypothetical protein
MDVFLYFMDTWSILRPFDIFYGHLVHFVVCNLAYFPPFWYVVQSQIWQP